MLVKIVNKIISFSLFIKTNEAFRFLGARKIFKSIQYLVLIVLYIFTLFLCNTLWSSLLKFNCTVVKLLLMLIWSLIQFTIRVDIRILIYLIKPLSRGVVFELRCILCIPVRLSHLEIQLTGLKSRSIIIIASS